MVAAAKQAAGQLAQMTQEQLDVIIREIAADCAANAQRLAKLANEKPVGNWRIRF